MHNLSLRAAFILGILAGFSFLFSVNAQQLYTVSKGERPPIDLKSLQADAWEAGVLKIKLTEQAMRQMEQSKPSVNRDGILSFGLASLDALNSQYAISQFSETFSSPAFESQFAERHRAWGFHRWFTLFVDAEADIAIMAEAFQALAEVEHAEPEYKKRLIGNAPDNASKLSPTFDPAAPASRWTPDDPQLDQQWHYHNTGQQNGTAGADISLFEAWDIEKGSADVIVAIIDDGVQHTHPDLSGNMWDGIGFNFVNNSPNIVPGNHGTHVAGTVAAVSNNEVGVAGVAGGTGAGDGVRLMSCQVFAGSSQGGFHLAPVWAADNGAAISQNSWGYQTPNVYDQNVLDAIDYFNENGGGDALIGGGITIFAAGNDNGDAAYYPGYYSGAFTIAATNNQDVKSWYSNYGSWVEISAPGGETNTVNARGVLSTLTNNGYGFYQGTSMACPHVSGVAALMASVAFGELSPDEIAEILLSTTDDIYALNPGFIGKLGTGRLNALSALEEAMAYIDGVRNPAGFNAEAIDFQSIEVNWVPNDEGNAVVVAFSDTNAFGTPETGMSYQAGEEIPGGGMVLYAGLETSLLHEDLPSATAHFYRAWSYNNDFEYSTGRSASAITACEAYNMPFAEGFEESPALPFCWTEEVVVPGVSWTLGAGNGENNPPSAFAGNSNMYHRSTGLFETGLTTRLVTPQLDLSQATEATLNFHFTNALRSFLIFNYQDVLRIKYKDAIDAEWVLLETFNSNVPDWTEVNIELPELSGDYYIAFEAVANSGYGVCLDEISITGELVEGFYIQAVAGENGTIEPEGNVFVPQGGEQAFEIVADWGFHIGSLMVDELAVEEAETLETYTYLFEDVQQDHTITAMFSPNMYDLSLEIVPAGMGEAWFTGDPYHGNEITLEANPLFSAYDFSHWALEGDTLSKENPYTFMLLQNMEIAAHFKVVTGLTESDVVPVNIWPNPNSGLFRIELAEAATIQVYNAVGILVHQQELEAGQTVINLHELATGIYFIKVDTGEISQNIKLMLR